MAVGRDKRRLTAIFAADVVGYSRLIGADESGTRAALRAHRSARQAPFRRIRGGAWRRGSVWGRDVAPKRRYAPGRGFLAPAGKGVLICDISQREALEAKVALDRSLDSPFLKTLARLGAPLPPERRSRARIVHAPPRPSAGTNRRGGAPFIVPPAVNERSSSLHHAKPLFRSAVRTADTEARPMCITAG